MKKKLLLSLFLKFLFLIINGVITPSSNDSLFIYAIPHIKGERNNNIIKYEKYIRKIFDGYAIKIKHVKVPQTWPHIDLGQNQCVKLLNQFMKNNHHPCILFAQSQGAGTVLNWLKSATPEQTRLIKAVILDAPLVSANSAIFQRAKIVHSIPFSYYWLPYLAKLCFPFYSPGGMQPIKAIEALPDDTPIIIGHAENDHIIPYDDACALYGGLIKNKKRTFFIVKKNREKNEAPLHIKIFNDNLAKNQLIDILHHYKIIKKDASIPTNTSFHLPFTDTLAYKYIEKYNNLLSKEQPHDYLTRIFNRAYVVASGFIASLIFHF